MLPYQIQKSLVQEAHAQQHEEQSRKTSQDGPWDPSAEYWLMQAAWLCCSIDDGWPKDKKLTKHQRILNSSYSEASSQFGCFIWTWDAAHGDNRPFLMWRRYPLPRVDKYRNNSFLHPQTQNPSGWFSKERHRCRKNGTRQPSRVHLSWVQGAKELELGRNFSISQRHHLYWVSHGHLGKYHRGMHNIIRG